MTCNRTVGSSWTVDYWPANKVQKKVTHANPHYDCVFVWNPFSACSQLGTPPNKVECYTYQQRWYSYATGTWGSYSEDMLVESNEC
jgi:hypothetical protein